MTLIAILVTRRRTRTTSEKKIIFSLFFGEVVTPPRQSLRTAQSCVRARKTCFVYNAKIAILLWYCKQKKKRWNLLKPTTMMMTLGKPACAGLILQLLVIASTLLFASVRCMFLYGKDRRAISLDSKGSFLGNPPDSEIEWWFLVAGSRAK